MNLLDTVFARLRSEGRRAFIPFITAGDPDPVTTVQVLPQLAAAGADVIEIGFPFSDPIADGPTIQASYTRALDRGLKVDDIFHALRQAKVAGLTTPVVGMVSYSLIHRRGASTFVQEALDAGFSGLIVPDLVADEADTFAELCRAKGCSLILLVTPTTTPERAKKIVALCSGFVYCVSIVGITGASEVVPEALQKQLATLRTLTDLPLCVGFGVSKPQHVEQLKPIADGVIVGSALVKKLHDEGLAATVKLVRELVQPLR